MPRAAPAFVLALGFCLLFAGALHAAPPLPGKRGRTTPPAHSVSRQNLAAAMARLQAGKAQRLATAPDTLRLLALRVEFPDLRFGDSPPGELHDRFYYEVQFSQVQQYFTAASSGRTTVRVDVPDGVALAAQPQDFYGDYAAYDSLMVRLSGEAVTFFDPSVDFAAYDACIVLHAGPGQESDIAGNSPTQIWSGFIDEIAFREVLSTPDSVQLGHPTADGVLVREAIVLPEWEVQDLEVTGGTRTGALGVYAHEIGQKLGMLPLFDPDPTPIPDAQGVGNFCLMGYGLWVANGFIPALPCTFNRMLVGWVDPIDVVGDGEFVLRDQETGPPDSVVARIPVSAREYFLVSYVREDVDGPVVCGDTLLPRFFHFEDKNGNCAFDYVDTNGDGILSPGDAIDTFAGAEWDFFLTDLVGLDTAGDGVGLLVLHVDELAMQEVLSQGGTNVQSDPRRKGVDVEEADGIEDLDRFPDNVRSFGSAEDYFGRTHLFAPETLPSTATTMGAPSGVSLELLALPDSTTSALDPNFPLPGARARLQVRLDVTTRPEVAPHPEARRLLDGECGADLVALPQADGSKALVVPGEAGKLYLLDRRLDDLPAADGDASTLLPWAALPPQLQGTWASAPAVGDLDGDGASEVVLVATTDTLPGTHVFAWHRDGSGAGNDALFPPLVTTLAGAPRSLALLDLGGTAAAEIVVATEDAGGVHLWTSLPPPACPQRVASQVPGARLGGGPVGVRWPTTASPLGLAWVETDSLAASGKLFFQVPSSCPVVGVPSPSTSVLPLPVAPPYRMLAGDLDGDGDDEILLADAAGTLLRATPTASGAAEVTVLERLGESLQTPLALADLDGDGSQEILVASTRAMHVLSFSGAERAGWPSVFARDPSLEAEPAPGAGAGTPLAADLDGDGAVEVLLHLPGGALLVWDGTGQRRRELEAALPAALAVSPLLADLDGDGRAELAALARFARLRAWDPARKEVSTQTVTDCGVWSWPQLGEVAWAEVGGGSGHAFLSRFERELLPQGNDAALSSFVVAPNPATAELRARVELTAPATAFCDLYNLEGERVRRQSRAGTTGEIVEFHLDVSALASGIYLARMELSTGGTRVLPVAIRR